MSFWNIPVICRKIPVSILLGIHSSLANVYGIFDMLMTFKNSEKLWAFLCIYECFHLWKKEPLLRSNHDIKKALIIRTTFDWKTTFEGR